MAKRFSGPTSIALWLAINRVEGPDHELLYDAGCAAQEMEAEVAQLRKLKGTDDDPEDRCDRCGGRNITWYADSALWNRVAGEWSILCPICFAELAAEMNIIPTTWELRLAQ